MSYNNCLLKKSFINRLLNSEETIYPVWRKKEF